MALIDVMRGAVGGAVRRAPPGPVADGAASTRTGPSHPTHVGLRDAFEPAPPRAPTTWWAGRPLAEARNAHSTNTRAHFAQALKDGSNWLEGDVRQELNGERLEMRHDKGHESGDNLTLAEWLAMGKASGRGLKLDVKEGERLHDVVAEVKRAGVPSERLMWNLSDKDMATWAPALRREFPAATLAVNPAAGNGPLSAADVHRMITHARAGGQPVTFVVRHDRLTDEAIGQLKQHGTISVWNDPGRGGLGAHEIDATARALRSRGVDGVVDLRPSLGTSDKLAAGVDKLKNIGQGLWQKAGRLWPF